MRILVTGASGWIGQAVSRELLRSGNQVMGLARTDRAANVMDDLGAEVLRGTLDDLDLLHSAAGRSDGVIHLAFKHDLAFGGDFMGAALADRRAVETFGDALADSGRPLVIASGTLGVSPGQISYEIDGHTDPTDLASVGEGPLARRATAEYTLSLATRGVRSVVVRLPPTNHGDGDNGFLAMLVSIARETGQSCYIGSGSNRWPAVHRLDSAHLFCLALEQARPGATLHAVAEEGVAIRDIAGVIGRHLNVPVVSIDETKAQEHFTWLAQFLQVDSPASSAMTRELLNWEPVEPDLIDDLDAGHYFVTR